MSVNFYPVEKTENICTDYEVKINGKTVELNVARVSAVPFNRRWPGHQRGLEQTELINFLSLEADEPLHFEIQPQKPFENVIIRPLSLGIEPEVSEDGVISFTLDKNAYFTVEPYGRNNALHIFADPISAYDIDKNSEDVIYYGTGEHDVGVINLKSNQTLFIDEGAVVYACVRAMDAENIKIIGRGILDNSHNKEEILFEYNAENNDCAIDNAKREHTVQIEYCTNIEIDGITIRDSLVYNIRPIGCKDLHISNVKILGCWRYNSDGIDMHNCVDVLIQNCFIRTFDDSICIKGFDCYYEGDVEEEVRKAMYRNGKAYDVFKNVLVKDCVIWNDWGKCLEIGTETRAEEITDIVFENCDVIHVTGPVLDCFNIDYADVHDIIYRNINVEYDDIIMEASIQSNDDERYINNNPNYSPDLICVITDYHHEYSAGGVRRGKCHDIKFENIKLFGKYEPKCYFKGYDNEHKTKDIVIENIYWNGKLLDEIKKEKFEMQDHTENIIYRTTDNRYSQMDKNTVSAINQLEENEDVRFINLGGKGKGVMFVGNSITLHSVCPDIGWHNECGMAASSEENDYVHILINEINNKEPDSRYCICQVAEWEWEYKDGESKYHIFESARDFEADVIVMRFVENCPKDNFDPEIFKKELNSLLSFLDKSENAKIIMTTGFWKHPGDDAIIEYAKENNLPCVELGDLGELDEMKAVGLFEHDGVANHPGDLGMKKIAERIFEELKKII